MATPAELKEKLQRRLAALMTQRSERVAAFNAELAELDKQITAIRNLAQQWDSLTVEQGITLLNQTGVRFDLQS